MAIVTYPLNGIQYDSNDVEAYNSTRTSGVFSGDHFGATISGARQITIGTGLAWINNGEFKGKSVVSTSPVVLSINAADNQLNRIDRIVLRFDAVANASSFVVKSGNLASNPIVPDVTKTEQIYELGLYQIYVPAASTEITYSNITSTVLDEDVCGIMRDGVTGIPTEVLYNQFTSLLNEFRNDSAEALQAVRNELTNIENGQSAYNAALLGGYIGSKEQFNADLGAMDGLADWFETY